MKKSFKQLEAACKAKGFQLAGGVREGNFSIMRRGNARPIYSGMYTIDGIAKGAKKMADWHK
jgi:hypothetical protein